MKINKVHILYIILVIFISCSTEKNTIVSRGFHNMHAKYNGFFNANEIIKLTYQEFKEKRKENYSKILPIYPLPSIEQSKSWYSPMDTAAGKCELVIYRHRMPHAKKGRNRNKEWCKWIDDNWLTIARTKFYKKELAKALKIFQYIESHYPTQNTFYESIFWQAKVLIEMGAYDEAEEILVSLINKRDEQLIELPKEKERLKFQEKVKLFFNYEQRIDYLEQKEPELPSTIINNVYPTLADLYLRNNKRELAIATLEQTIELKYKKAFKTRLIYILAQLYHKDGNFKASTYYQQVVERNPEYEMAFQAKINRALSFSGGQTKAIKSQLLKMLKDDKNIEYFDQIYYALAEIEFKDKNEKLAVENLQTSINVSQTNTEQKIKSLKRMGDWYYTKPNYTNAFYYYDSIQKIIPPKLESKHEIDKKHKLLKKIFLNLETINFNDSIFRICALPEDQRMEKIFEVIDAIEEEKERQQENDLLASTNQNLPMPSSNSVLSQTIFFWDATMLERGKKEFDLKWGERALEDNWRRSAKKSSIISEEELTENNSESNAIYEQMLGELPCDNLEKKEAMKDSILASLFNLGLTHHYETENLKQAKIYFKRVLANYQPRTEAVASAYELYRIHEHLSNTSEKKQMKDLLLSKYPKSKYAKLILGNGNVTEEQKKLKAEKESYHELYSKYSLGDYNWVIEQCDKKIQDSLNPLFCDYGLLKAYAQGKFNRLKDSSNSQIIKTLKLVANNCQGSDKGEQAIQILKKLKINSAQSAFEKQKWKFVYNPDTVHFFILFVPKGSFDINKAKNSVADLNMASFSSKRLKTSNKFLNTSDQMIMVKMFKDAKEAMDYYVAFKVNKGPVKSYKNKDFFILSPHNLKEMYLEKKIENYKLFFNEFYL